jgi:hypothetical protein
MSRQCRNCGKPIPNNLTYCNETCLRENFQKRKENREKSISPKHSETGLKEIYDFLDLNEPKDGRLVIKADIMKKIIFLLSKWKIGNKREWIDKLSVHTCVSTRKIREDYLQPLITIGILVETSYTIQFQGLPKKEAFL